MELTLALAQTKHPEDGDVLAMTDAYMARAKGAGASLIAFPESLMTPFELKRDEFFARAQPLDGPFASGMDGLARQHGLWVLYTANELRACGQNPYNTAVLAAPDGTKRLVYRKSHLFDCGKTRESRRMSAGDCIEGPAATPFGGIGVAICYDLRFPEVARIAAQGGADLMLYTAAWVKAPGKELQWKTLLSARAIENGMYVAGVSRADNGYIGRSCVFDPAGQPVAMAGCDEELLICELDMSLPERVREAMPTLKHRRPELY